MNPQLFHDLAASEESSGYPANARALRAVPEMVEALRKTISLLDEFTEDWQIDTTDPEANEILDAARAALAALDATTKKEIEA